MQSLFLTSLQGVLRSIPFQDLCTLSAQEFGLCELFDRKAVLQRTFKWLVATSLHENRHLARSEPSIEPSFTLAATTLHCAARPLSGPRALEASWAGHRSFSRAATTTSPSLAFPWGLHAPSRPADFGRSANLRSAELCLDASLSQQRSNQCVWLVLPRGFCCRIHEVSPLLWFQSILKA